MSDQDATPLPPLPNRTLIDGKLVEAERTYPTVNPATGQVFAHAPDASVADAEAAVAAARRALDTTSWPTDVAFRARCLDQLHKALTEHKEELRELTITDVGAPRQITDGAQLDQPIEIVRFYADLLPGYPLTEEIGQIEFMGKQHRRGVEKEAAGVVNVISSSSVAVGEALTTSPDVDLVTFTGATATGRAIMAAAAGTIKRVFLELGGKSALVVLDDADLAEPAMVAAFATCSHAGQGCAIPTRMVVPRARHDEVVAQVTGLLGAVKFGDPADPANYMGPLISERQRDKVDGLVQRAIAAGATLVAGGTVIIDGDDDAVRIASNSIYGLSGSVYSADYERALGVARRIRTGTISVNGGMWFGPDVPFGGYKQSGIGREMGAAGLEEFLERKSLATVVA